MKKFFKILLGGLLGFMLATSNGAASTPISVGPSLSAAAQTDGMLVKAVESEEAGETRANGTSSPGLRPFDQVVGELEPLEGLVTLYRDREQAQVYLALTPQQLNHNYLLVTTLASGIGESGLFDGWPLSDQVIQFRRAPGNKLQVVVPNFNFRARDNSPQIQRSYSDSVVASLPIVSISETDTLLVDFDSLLLANDLPDFSGTLGWLLGGYVPDASSSYVSEVKSFPENIELDAQLNFNGISDGSFLFGFESLPDARGFTVTLHYSLSDLPVNNGYRPRLADERIGYFVTAYQEPLAYNRRDPFVRYIQRWRLERQDTEAELSPPREPIVFWIENTVPTEYRQAIRDGALWWNDAFEQAGFKDAIEVRQMPDGAPWDPADVRYNTIRWSTSFRPWAVALGPSRANPLTGEILDADIIIDANVIRTLRGEYQMLANGPSGEGYVYSQLCGHRFQAHMERWLALQQGTPLAQVMGREFQMPGPSLSGSHLAHDTCFGIETSQQLSFSGLMLSTLRLDPGRPGAVDDYIQQYLRMLSAHEVGHTLGLRHNFQGSVLRSPD